jgi:hypothetical protein
MFFFILSLFTLLNDFLTRLTCTNKRTATSTITHQYSDGDSVFFTTSRPTATISSTTGGAQQRDLVYRAGDADVSSTSVCFFLYFIIITLLNDFFLLDNVNEWTNGHLQHHTPILGQRRKEDSCFSFTTSHPTASTSSTTTGGLDGGIQRMGLETSASPIPLGIFLLLSFFNLLNNFFY